MAPSLRINPINWFAGTCSATHDNWRPSRANYVTYVKRWTKFLYSDFSCNIVILHVVNGQVKFLEYVKIWASINTLYKSMSVMRGPDCRYAKNWHAADRSFGLTYRRGIISVWQRANGFMRTLSDAFQNGVRVVENFGWSVQRIYLVWPPLKKIIHTV